MKQVVQNYNSGDLWLEDVPVPLCRPGRVLVRNEYSVVSTGTERMKVSQARMSLLQKAKARPDQVKQVLNSVSQVGLADTYAKVRERLDAPTTLGYSCVGIVEEVGAGIDDIQPGQRVVCAGEGIACHAEFVCVPRNLCAVVPDGVDPKNASFATIGSIAMNGLRQCQVSLGDSVAIIGLGLVGLMAVQLLSAAGTRVFGIDVASDKLQQAIDSGAELAMARSDSGLVESIVNATDGRGVDAVYIAASTDSSDPMDLAIELVRDRGKVVIVGMVPVHGEWRTYYAKEAEILMSRSYGPGRYDRNFEEKGIDYPVGYVPWTQKRNLEEFVRLVGINAVEPMKFGAQVFPFEEAPEAYRLIHEAPGKHSAGVVFEYPEQPNASRRVRVDTVERTQAQGDVQVAMIGAGNFATGTLIPAIKPIDGINLHTICSAGGLSAVSAAARHGFEYAVSDPDEVFGNSEVDAVVVVTRHDTHAQFVLQALEAGKHVFVEKPLALNEEDIDAIEQASAERGLLVMAGFNRRHSPLAKAARAHFSPSAGPLEVVCRVNAGSIEADSWYQDQQEGGWRIVSEGCHFVDLMSYLVRAQPASVSTQMVESATGGIRNDNFITTITFSNGSIGTFIYVANGDSSFEKERIEVFGQDKVAVIANWRRAELFSGGKRQVERPKGTGKGHAIQMQAFIDAVRNPGSLEDDHTIAVSRATLLMQRSMLAGAERLSIEA